MSGVSFVACLFATVFLAYGAPVFGAGPERAYWIWHREHPLHATEITELKHQSVTKLYWHTGDLFPNQGLWETRQPVHSIPVMNGTFQVIPVLRLSAEGTPAFQEQAIASLTAALKEALSLSNANEIQVDYDCPDRLVPQYASLLRECRKQIAPNRLSATALAGWSRLPAFPEFYQAVDELVPMFYDLTPDTPEAIREGRFEPLLDAAILREQLNSWQQCRTPWRAGLPNFARVSLYDSKGKSLGHLRNWDWDEIVFNPALVFAGIPGPGTTTFRVEQETQVSTTRMNPGDMIAVRMVDLDELQKADRLITASNALGTVLFRLPVEGNQGGWSLTQVGEILQENSTANPLRLKAERDHLVLKNPSGIDLPVRLSGKGGPRDRGWQLEIESDEGAIFREALRGEFTNIFAHVRPDAPEPARVSVPLGSRLTYWFSGLPSGRVRATGLLQLAPGNDLKSLRWRIPGSPKNADWKKVE